MATGKTFYKVYRVSAGASDVSYCYVEASSAGEALYKAAPAAAVDEAHKYWAVKLENNEDSARG